MPPTRERSWRSAKPVETRYQLANADVIVSLDADFLFPAFRDSPCIRPTGLRAAMPTTRQAGTESHVRDREFADDHRFQGRSPHSGEASEVEEYARALATPFRRRWRRERSAARTQQMLDAIAKDLQAHRGSAVVVAGRRISPPAVHALAHAMNEAFGAVGQHRRLYRSIDRELG